MQRCVERLASIIEGETRLLKEGGRLDFPVLNARKTHALLEFTLASKSARPGDFACFGDTALRLKDALEENKEYLERRLRATQEIASLILAGIRRDESDGTYKAFRQKGRE
ncbi:hypothetical protein F7D14_11265 [Methylocystis parvus]|uniref:Flagellar protein FlgN n=1 Tax=Methylocystis parvus TaxID=134 RepID=A0A6B8MG59_9HYPH|nr:hypothetical protein F7D14_11265 [Methylocystis parvus]